jgi:hypothetical protein
MYRKRRAARTMIRSIELKAPSDQQKLQELAGSKEPVPLQLWTPVSSVDSFCSTSFAAGTVASASNYRNSFIFCCCRGCCSGHASARRR